MLYGATETSGDGDDGEDGVARRLARRERHISTKIGITEMNTMRVTTGRMYLSMSAGSMTVVICLASAQPARTMPSVHSTPPMTFHMKNWRAGISSTPATGLRNVRTIGMNRANTTAFAGPNLLK